MDSHTTRNAPRRRASVRATTARIGALAGVASLLVWGGLSLQMAAGHDPELAPKQRQANGTTSSAPTAPTTPAPMTPPTTPATTSPAPVQTSTS